MKPPRKQEISERLDGMEQRVAQWIEESRGRVTELFAGLRIESLAGAASAPEASPRETAALEELSRLAHDVSTLSDQVAVLNRLVAAAAALADRAVLFVVREGALRGWSAAGLDGSINPRTFALSLEEDTLVARAVNRCDAVQALAGDPSAKRIAQMLGGEPPAEMAAAPLWVRDRVAAVLYADTTEPSGWLAGSLAAAATMASLTLEALPLRAKHPRPLPDAPAPAPPEPLAQAAPRSAPVNAGAQRHAVATASVGTSSAGADAPPDAEDPEAAQRAAEARRFARLLVSEIVLYNAAEIAEGRRQKDLYPRLKDDIERSRRMYDQRIGQEHSPAVDHFHDELVRELAGGDESALGMT